MIISILLSGGNISNRAAQVSFIIFLVFISFPLGYKVYKLSKNTSSVWNALSIIICSILLIASLFFLFIFGGYGFA
jgi:hypothetical protein